MIGMGRLDNNIYFLETTQTSNAFVLSLSTMSKCNICHMRLGHPSAIKLQLLHDSLHISASLTDLSSHCQTCHIAKQKRLPFPSRNNFSETPFDMIHLDTWGPFQIPTIEEYKFFLTIVDDCSQATWTYLMRTKSDVTYMLPNFYNHILTQYKTNIKAIKSDNALAFTLHEFFDSKGILHYHSCVETPEQNSVVERQHQHILNVARSLL